MQLLFGWAISIGVAQTACAQNYARYCARDTDQLANDVTLAITSQDVNYLATLYNWAGFSSESAYARMSQYDELVNRSLVSVDPVLPGTPLALWAQPSTRGPLLAVSLFLLGWLQDIPPKVQDTPEIGPYPADPNDRRGLGELPPLPPTPAPTSSTPAPPADPWAAQEPAQADTDVDDMLRQSREASERFEANLQRELRSLARTDGWVSSSDFSASMVPASAIRVVTEHGRFRTQKYVLTFGVMKFEGCYWLSGG